jgi:hypothetical protein
MMHKRYTSKNFFVRNVDLVYAEHRKIGKATRILGTVHDTDFSSTAALLYRGNLQLGKHLFSSDWRKEICKDLLHNAVHESSNTFLEVYLYIFFPLVAPTRGSVLPFRSIGLIVLSFLIRTIGRTPWTGD